MKNKFAILNYSIEHFTNQLYVDARLVPFDRESEINYIILTSKTFDLNECTLEFKLNFDNWEQRPFLSTDRLWPLFSNELIEIIKKHYKELVYFPVKLIDKKGKEYTDKYSAVQIPSVEGLVNYDLSVFERNELFPEIFASVSKIVFHAKIKPDAIFRLHEYAQVILITESLAKDLIKHSLKNITITNIQDYNWESF